MQKSSTSLPGVAPQHKSLYEIAASIMVHKKADASQHFCDAEARHKQNMETCFMQQCDMTILRVADR